MTVRSLVLICRIAVLLGILITAGCAHRLQSKHTDVFASAGEVPLLDVARLIQHEWQELQFSGHTDYNVVSLESKLVLWARGQDSASALIRFVEFDTKRCPTIEWSWRVDQLQQNANLNIKSKEDVAASIYLLFGDPGLLSDPDPVPTLRYVWTNSTSNIGAIIDSPYLPGIVRSIVIQSGKENLGSWVNESRNLYEDYRLAFGQAPAEPVQAILLFTDNDQTGQAVEAGYAWAKAICQ